MAITNFKKFLQEGGTKTDVQSALKSFQTQVTQAGGTIKPSAKVTTGGGGGGGGGGYSYVEPTTEKGYEVSPEGVKKEVIPSQITTVTSVQTPTQKFLEEGGSKVISPEKFSFKEYVEKQKSTMDYYPKKPSPLMVSGVTEQQGVYMQPLWESAKQSVSRVGSLFGFGKTRYEIETVFDPFAYSFKPKEEMIIGGNPLIGYKKVNILEQRKGYEMEAGKLKTGYETNLSSVVQPYAKEKEKYYQELIDIGAIGLPEAQTKYESDIGRFGEIKQKEFQTLFETDIRKISEKYPYAGVEITRPNPFKEVAKMLVVASPYTAPIYLAKSGVAPLSTEGIIASTSIIGGSLLGVSKFGAIGRIEKGIVQAELEGLSMQPLKYKSLIIEGEKGGVALLKGERIYGGLREEVEVAGKLLKKGERAYIIPYGEGASKVAGTLNWNLLSPSKGATRVVGASTFEVGGKGITFNLGKIGTPVRYEFESATRVFELNEVEMRKTLGAPSNVLGRYYRDTGDIFIRGDLPTKLKEYTLAHELGHKFVYETGIDLSRFESPLSLKQAPKMFKEYPIEKLGGELAADFYKGRIAKFPVDLIYEQEVFGTLSKSVVIPKYSTGAFFQMPTTEKGAVKVGELMGKQFAKNLQRGGKTIISFDVQFSTKAGENLFFGVTPQYYKKISSYGITKIVKPNFGIKVVDIGSGGEGISGGGLVSKSLLSSKSLLGTIKPISIESSAMKSVAFEKLVRPRVGGITQLKTEQMTTTLPAISLKETFKPQMMGQLTMQKETLKTYLSSKTTLLSFPIYKQRVRGGLSTSQIDSQGLGSGLLQGQILGTKLSQGLLQKQIQEGILTPSPFTPPKFDFGFGFRGGGFVLPPLWLPMGRESSTGLVPYAPRGLGRTPSFAAAQLGIYSFKPLKMEFTGLIERPLIKRKRKR